MSSIKKEENILCNVKYNRKGRFVEASLLCLLKEREDYGYSLMERFSELGFEDDSINMSIIYRNLKNMENENLITSSWKESEQGPDKKVYNITSKGEDVLKTWIDLLKYRKKGIESIINKYENMG